MKKTYKKIVGLFGLVVVIATTVFAAFLPGPDTSALSSVTDTIVVRVVSAGPNIDVVTPASGEVTTSSTQEITFNYENVTEISVTVQYTDPDGTVHNITLETFTPSESVGTRTITIDTTDPLFGDGKGFGDFVVTVTGVNSDTGGTDGDTIEFTHIPVTTEIEEDKTTGEINAILDYDDTDENIKQIEINIYDKDGNLIEGISPIIVDAPTKVVPLPLEEYGLEAGDYIVKTKALGDEGDALYDDYVVNMKYDIIDVPTTDDVDVPDTGGLFAGLNISKSDYLVTGLVIFFLVGATGLFYIARKRNNKR